MTEEGLQRTIIDHWRYRGVPGSVLAAIPNGEARSPITGAKLKAQGVMPGMPDLFAAGKSAAFIELKRPSKQPAEKALSDAQKNIIPKIRASGVPVYVSNSLEEVLKILEEIGVLKERNAV
jgi:hypothetical protein